MSKIYHLGLSASSLSTNSLQLQDKHQLLEIIMVVSKDSSAPLVVVVGITGNQGGSVADHLIISDKPYRIVGLTRDASKPAAKEFSEKGVVLKEVDLKPSNEPAVAEVFKDADIVFASSFGALGVAERIRD